jgi:uncharacterized membrane protein
VGTENDSNLVKYQFKTLLSYGRLVSSLGWVIFIVGFIVILLSIAMISKRGNPLGFMSIIWGAITAISGISIVIWGQIISCFVSIERNTRATYIAVKESVKLKKC